MIYSVVLGIDPGWRNMGWMRLRVDGDRLTYQNSGTVKTNTKQKLMERTLIISNAIEAFLDAGAELVGIEEQLAFFSKTVRANKDSEKTRHVVTLVRARAVQRGMMVDECPPKEMRSVFGLPPGATKMQTASMLKRLTNGVPDGLSEHEYDAGVVGHTVWKRSTRPELRRQR